MAPRRIRLGASLVVATHFGRCCSGAQPGCRGLPVFSFVSASSWLPIIRLNTQSKNFLLSRTAICRLQVLLQQERDIGLHIFTSKPVIRIRQ